LKPVTAQRPGSGRGLSYRKDVRGLEKLRPQRRGKLVDSKLSQAVRPTDQPERYRRADRRHQPPQSIDIGLKPGEQPSIYIIESLAQPRARLFHYVRA